MGVRFECPNGHKLHVKAHLAGKRGVCPDCGARFVVPSFSGGVANDPASAAAGAQGGDSTAGGPPSVVIATTGTASRAGAANHAAPVSAPPAAAGGEGAAAWYVRPATGGQFGPASTEAFRQWIAEGRVAADAWVWRTGWPDWKAGSEALALVDDGPPPPTAGAASAVAIEPLRAAQPAAGVDALLRDDLTAASAPVPTAEARRAELRRRKRKARNLSLVLGVLALGVLIALLIVLNR
jgi:hypothetical protein